MARPIPGKRERKVRRPQGGKEVIELTSSTAAENKRRRWKSSVFDTDGKLREHERRRERDVENETNVMRATLSTTVEEASSAEVLLELLFRTDCIAELSCGEEVGEGGDGWWERRRREVRGGGAYVRSGGTSDEPEEESCERRFFFSPEGICLLEEIERGGYRGGS